jgi:hypothetical protein
VNLFEDAANAMMGDADERRTGPKKFGVTIVMSENVAPCVRCGGQVVRYVPKGHAPVIVACLNCGPSLEEPAK